MRSPMQRKVALVLSLSLALCASSFFAPQASARRVVSAVSSAARSVGNAVSDAARRAADAAKAAAEAAARKAKEVAEAAARAAKNAAEAAAKKAKEVAEAAAKAAKELADKIAAGVKKLAELKDRIVHLTKQLAEFTTGTIAELIKVFKEGPQSLLRWVARKLPGPVGDVVDALFFQGGSLVERLERVGKILLSGLQSMIDSVKKGIKSGIDNVVKPLIAKVQELIGGTVFKPAIAGLANLFQGQIDAVVGKVVETILGKTDFIDSQMGALTGVLNAIAKGDMSAVDSKLAAYGTSLDTVGKDVVKMAMETGLGFLRGKVVDFVMRQINKLMSKVWTWAYTGVSAARNAVQGAVGSVPFAGGVLAAAVGTLIDEGWELLKSAVDGFIEGKVNEVADLALSKAQALLSGAANKAGGLLQELVNVLRPMLTTIAQKAKERIDPVLGKYRGIVDRLQKLRAARAAR